MSPLVTRPSLPEPGTVAASMPLSAEILRTDGASVASADGAFGAAATAAAGAATAGAGDGAPALAGAPTGVAPAPPSLTWPSESPPPAGFPALAPVSPTAPRP